MRTILLMISLALATTSCASWKKPKVDTEPPRIDCSERAPAEPAPAARGLQEPTTADWRAWRTYGRRWAAYARRWAGVATIEVTKRAEVADCLDRERAAKRIQ